MGKFTENVAQPLYAFQCQSAIARLNAADFFEIVLRFCWVYSSFCVRVWYFRINFYLDFQLDFTSAQVCIVHCCCRFILFSSVYRYLIEHVFFPIYVSTVFFPCLRLDFFPSICSILKVIPFMYSLSDGIFHAVFLFLWQDSGLIILFPFFSGDSNQVNGWMVRLH